jgi:K+-sensing histidine kinase KdpD
VPVWARAFLLQFALAAAVSLAAALVAFGLVTRLPGYAGVPLFVFVFSTAIAGYAGGLASGLLAVAFSLAVGLFVVVPPTFLLSVTAAPQVVVMFAAVLFLTALMAGRLRAATAEQTAARARAEEMATRLREVTAVTEENVQQLEAQERRAESLSALIKVATDIHSARHIEEVMQAIAEAATRLAGGG